MSSRRLAPRRIPAILDDPARSRGDAFSLREREQLGLTGRLPPAVQTLAEQADRAYRQLRSLPDDVARGIYLGQLQDRNETLYFRVLADHLADLLPLVADPAAGEPASLYPAEHRRPGGIYLSADRPGQIEPALATLGLGPDDVDIIACSDAADLPGLGDWGLAGARTAAGKLAVYTAGAGIRPDRVIAVSLDAGTDNEALLRDPLYPGSRHARRRGADYGAFLGRYVQTAAGLFPGALLHFQDFTAAQARATLQAYAADYRVFDGGLQGGGAMVLAAVYAASRVTGIPVKHQVMVVAGPDEAGVAAADQVCDAITADGATREQARDQIWLVDGRGLLLDDRAGLRDFQAPYAKRRSAAGWAAGPGTAGLATVIARTEPTILLGTSAAGQAFTPQVIGAMCRATGRPLILPAAVPGTRLTATPAEIIAWSDGRALVATAMAAAPAEHAGATFAIARLDSALIFPGIGLGAVVSRAARVTPRMLRAAAAAVAEQADASGPGAPLLPGVRHLRALSAQVAAAVVRAAVADKVAAFNPTSLARAISDAMWVPAYPDLH